MSGNFKLGLEILGKIGIYKLRTKDCPEAYVFTTSIVLYGTS